jgi:hypothetical protein
MFLKRFTHLLWNKVMFSCEIHKDTTKYETDNYADNKRNNFNHICESVVENEEEESDCQLPPAMDHQRIS